MKRLLVLLVVVIACALAGSLVTPEDPGPVYIAAILDDYPAVTTVEIFERTDERALPQSDPQRPKQSAISQAGYQHSLLRLRPDPETRGDFEQRNRRPQKLSIAFSDRRFRLVGDGETSASTLWVSAVGFNPTHTQAMVSVNYQWATLDFLLEKDPAGHWQVLRKSQPRGGMELAD